MGDPWCGCVAIRFIADGDGIPNFHVGRSIRCRVTPSRTCWLCRLIRCGRSSAAADHVGIKRLVMCVALVIVGFYCTFQLTDYFLRCLHPLVWQRAYDPSKTGGTQIIGNRYSERNMSHVEGSEIEIYSLFVQNVLPRPINNSHQRIIDQLQFVERYANQFTGSRPVKVILRAGYFNFYDWVEGSVRFLNDRCPVTDCLLTTDYDRYHETADALIISEINFTSVQRYLPKPRHQIWIAQHMEPPTQNRLKPDVVANLINWTASYRRDSIIPFPYYFMSELPPKEAAAGVTSAPPHSETPSNTVNYASGRKKQVAWFVTNCRDHNGRKSYVRELRNYAGVDVYGRCGTFSCKSNDECFAKLKHNYKFYLAFENSNCWDYITEKLFRNAFSNNVVPVVMGARVEDYADAVPPNSYIHVDNFKSPRDLGAYLRHLDANDTAYNEYFRWKSHWTITTDTKYWCRLGGLLHAAPAVDWVHWYEDYTSWWNGVCTADWTAQNGARWKTWQHSLAHN